MAMAKPMTVGLLGYFYVQKVLTQGVVKAHCIAFGVTVACGNIKLASESVFL